jgi:hypothetical protein
MTAADMIAVLIAASTSFALAESTGYKPTRAAAAHPPHSASFLGHTSHRGQTIRLSRAAAPRPAPNQVAAGQTSVAVLSENNEIPTTEAIGTGAAAESLHTAIR